MGPSGIAGYERDAYRRELATEVLEAGEERGRHWARLADTVLYPEGGGQPADRGRLGEVAVVHVERRRGQVLHWLAGPVSPGPVEVQLDWERRYDHMQQHTGQHLLTALAQDRFGWATRSFHLGAETSSVDLDAPSLGPGRQIELGEALAREVRAARPVTSRRVAPERLAALGVRSRGLPEDHQGEVRLVEIEGIDCNTCGGTHVRSTAELELVHLLGAEAARGGTRLHFVAGARARRRLAFLEERAAGLRRLVGAGDEDLVGVVEGRLEGLREAAGREARLREELAEAWAGLLGARPAGILEAHFEGRDLGFLQDLGRRLARDAPGRVALLTAGPASAGVFVVVAGGGSGHDARRLGARVAELLGGRGGGAGPLFQGRAGSFEGRARALAQLEEMAAGAGPVTA